MNNLKLDLLLLIESYCSLQEGVNLIWYTLINLFILTILRHFDNILPLSMILYKMI